jgi:hypothetical protein
MRMKYFTRWEYILIAINHFHTKNMSSLFRLQTNSLCLLLLASCVASLFLSAHAHAESKTGLCTAKEEVVWECPLQRKAVALCASKGEPSAASTLQYRFGTAARIELKYPDTPQSPNRFAVSETAYSGGGEFHIRFNIAGHDYFLFERTVRTGFGSDGLNNPEFSDGVATRYRGKITSVRNCTAPPNGSISNGIQKFMVSEDLEQIF